MRERGQLTGAPPCPAAGLGSTQLPGSNLQDYPDWRDGALVLDRPKTTGYYGAAVVSPWGPSLSFIKLAALKATRTVQGAGHQRGAAGLPGSV